MRMLLSFDDLVRIFEYLELSDQLNVARADANFHDIIVNSIWRRRFTEICVPHLEDGETDRIVCKANKQINKLNKEDYQEFFRWNICNLRKLRLDNLISQYWKYFLGHNLLRPDMDYYLTFHYTRLIELACVNLSLIFHDGTMRHMAAHCPLVERLTVSSRNVTGQYLSNFRRLRRLSLANCSLKVSHLSELLEKTAQLEFLDICGNMELLSVMVPTWGLSLKQIQLDEEAFLKQFVCGHELPRRLRNIRTFSIDCNGSAKDNDKTSKWLQFLQQFGDSIRKLKLPAKSATVHEALQAIYSMKRAPIFDRLQELHFIADNIGVGCLKYFFGSSNLKVVYIHRSEHVYSLYDVIQLLHNNENLLHICFDVGAVMGEQYWRFLDSLITFKRQHKTLKPLKLEIRRLQKKFINNFEDSENFYNLKELKEIRDKLLVSTKGALFTELGLEIYVQMRSYSEAKVSELFEIYFFDDQLQAKMEILDINETENVYIEPKLAGEEENTAI